MKVSHKVGDVIRIRSDLVIGEKYDHLEFTEEMAHYAGRELVVTKIGNDAYGEFYETNHSYCDTWTEPMIEDYEEIEPVSIDIGDIL